MLVSLSARTLCTVVHTFRFERHRAYCICLGERIPLRRAASGVEAAEASDDEADQSEDEALGQLASEDLCSTLIRLLRTATTELSVTVHRETIRLVRRSFQHVPLPNQMRRVHLQVL